MENHNSLSSFLVNLLKLNQVFPQKQTNCLGWPTEILPWDWQSKTMCTQSLPHARVVRSFNHIHAFFMWPFNIVWTKMMAEGSNRSENLYIRTKRSSAAFFTDQVWKEISGELCLFWQKWLKLSDCPRTTAKGKQTRPPYSALNA